MGRKSSRTVILFVVLLIIHLPLNAPAEEARLISVAELKTTLDSGENIMLLNPLSDILFNEGNIPGSVNITLGEIWGSDRLPKDKETPIVSYCLGPRSLVSKKAADILTEMRYRNVRWFREGIAGWILAGYPLEYKNALPRVPVPALDAVQLRGRLKEVVILDIRPPRLYDSGWIKGSRRLPIDDLSKKYMELPKKRKIVVVDHAGNHVIVAARFLQQKGYDVHGLQGGILSWKSHGYPLEKELIQHVSSRVDGP